MFIALRYFVLCAALGGLVVAFGIGDFASGAQPQAISPPKLARYVRGLIDRFDRDRDGSLAPDEWKVMNGRPALADADGDRRLTFDELLHHVTSYGKSRTLRASAPNLAPLAPSAAAVASASVATPTSDSSDGEPPAKVENNAAVRRFAASDSAAAQRIPEWFLQSDADGDGQLTLAEFAPALTPDRRREFARYDDGDGVLTAEECLRGAGNSSSAR